MIRPARHDYRAAPPARRPWRTLARWTLYAVAFLLWWGIVTAVFGGHRHNYRD